MDTLYPRIPSIGSLLAFGTILDSDEAPADLPNLKHPTTTMQASVTTANHDAFAEDHPEK
jgi:hypothetical protein